ncbi:MAG: pilus assembly protein [Chloroflexota bacterium]|nr:pilus assembly protein [Chloroflexota bacterium]
MTTRPVSQLLASPRPRAGQSMVELALTLPLLLLLLLGTIDVGRCFHEYIQLRNAVREGAGYGAHMPGDTSGIVDRVTAHGVPSGTAVTVTCTGGCSTSQGTATGTGLMTVTATSTFTPVTTGFLQSWFGLGAIQLDVSASMRVLQ